MIALKLDIVLWTLKIKLDSIQQWFRFLDSVLTLFAEQCNYNIEASTILKLDSSLNSVFSQFVILFFFFFMLQFSKHIFGRVEVLFLLFLCTQKYNIFFFKKRKKIILKRSSSWKKTPKKMQVSNLFCKLVFKFDFLSFISILL